MHTLKDLMDAYTLEYLPEHTPGTQYEYRRLFVRILRSLGPVPLDDLTPDVLRAWKLTLSQGRNPNSVRHYCKILRAVLQIAVEDYGWLEVNPMQRVRIPSAPRGRIRFLSPTERVALLEACLRSPNPVLYPMVVVALNTGARKNEIRFLKWSEVNLQAGTIRFVETKNGESRVAPLLGEAMQVLTALSAARHPHVPWVFPDDAGKGPRWMDWHWMHARDEAGLHEFHFHDLRHTFASYCAMSGASLKDIAELLGHKTLQMTVAYTHLLQSHTTGVVERMAAQFLTTPPEAHRP